MGLKDLLTNPPQNFRYYVGGQGYTGNGSTPNMLNLKYGNDTLGGGDSNQPYIQTTIPTGFSGLQNSTSDFILRGGMLAVKDSVTDVRRLGKMFKDTKSPNGLLFVAKQNLLSRVAVRTQAATGPLNEGIYTPLSTLAQAGLVAFGGHLNKQGLNPFAGAGSNGYFQGSYLQATKNQTFTKGPEDTAQTRNRLVQLLSTKLIFEKGDKRITTAQQIYGNNSISKNPTDILTYTGGPGSILGVGNTNIRFATDNTGGISLTYANPVKYYLSTNYLTTGYQGFLSQDYTGNRFTTQARFIQTAVIDQNGQINTQLGDVQVNATKFSFNNDRTAPAYTATIRDFRDQLRLTIQNQGGNVTTLMSNAPDYTSQNLETRVNIGGTITQQGPGYKGVKNLISYTSGSGIGPIDKINALPIYRSDFVDTNQPVNDLVKFRIAAINTENPNLKDFIHFRAFLDSFSDNYTANWDTVNYLGRGENFYTYKGFNRTISMGWTVAAQSKEEIMIMYKKLNYLASNLAPSYTSKGYMAGNLVQLTIGGYLYEQVGFITSLTYDVPMESPWEIAINDVGGNDPSVKEVPHIIKVTGFNFTPIQSFISSKQDLYGFDKNDKGIATTYGDQRFIALANGDGLNYNNYDSDYLKTVFSKLSAKASQPISANAFRTP